jgi:hypothetical protein
VPLYGVILGRLGGGSSAPAQTSVHWGAAGIWVLGVAVFHACAQWSPQWGAALPTLAVTFTLAWLSRPATAAVSHA